MPRRGEVLETKRASWGGLLRKAACRDCGEICWFDGTFFYCQDCREPLRRPAMPLIPNSVRYRETKHDDDQ